MAYRAQRFWLTPHYRWLLLAGLPLMMACGAGYWAATRTPVVENAHAWLAELRRTIEERPEFMVNLMAIDGGSPELAEDIREILPLDFPLSSFDLDLADIRRRIEELDAVASAAVRIRSGGILQVDVVERVPAVVWRGPQGLELLDGDGRRVASLSHRTDRADLPLIAGEGAERAVPEALRLLAQAGPIGPRIRGLVRVGERRWDVVLDRDQRILLPEAGAETALARAVALQTGLQLFERDVALVDFRNPERPTLRLRGGRNDHLPGAAPVERSSLK